MDFKCDELILGKKDADSRALTAQGLCDRSESHCRGAGVGQPVVAGDEKTGSSDADGGRFIHTESGEK